MIAVTFCPLRQPERFGCSFWFCIPGTTSVRSCQTTFRRAGLAFKHFGRPWQGTLLAHQEDYWSTCPCWSCLVSCFCVTEAYYLCLFWLSWARLWYSCTSWLFQVLVFV